VVELAEAAGGRDDNVGSALPTAVPAGALEGATEAGCASVDASAAVPELGAVELSSGGRCEPVCAGAGCGATCTVLGAGDGANCCAGEGEGAAAGCDAGAGGCAEDKGRGEDAVAVVDDGP